MSRYMACMRMCYKIKYYLSDFLFSSAVLFYFYNNTAQCSWKLRSANSPGHTSPKIRLHNTPHGLLLKILTKQLRTNLRVSQKLLLVRRTVIVEVHVARSKMRRVKPREARVRGRRLSYVFNPRQQLAQTHSKF